MKYFDSPVRKLALPLFAAVLLAISALSYAQTSEPKHNFVPKAGYVPDAKTAISIAIAVWSPIYGEKKIQGEKPFKARLEKDVWIVEGSLPKGMAGGVAIAEISRRDGRILRVSHGK